ncbi:MAG: ABC transporter permease [Nocardioidaceae bacterium]
MTSLTFTRYELVRTFRNKRFFIFSLIFPLVMFVAIGGGNRDVEIVPGVSFIEYYMVGMAGWGAMMAVLAAGARISTERDAGWVRALRLTPLSVRSYIRAKLVTGYTMAALSIVLLYVAGLVLGVRFPAGQWLQMTGLVLVGLIPMAIFGILIGHLISPDSIGPVMGGVGSLFALLGGAWFLPTGLLSTLGQLLPSYWLCQAGRLSIAGESWPAKGWVVVAIWTVALTVLAASAYRRGEQHG